MASENSKESGHAAVHGQTSGAPGALEAADSSGRVDEAQPHEPGTAMVETDIQLDMAAHNGHDAHRQQEMATLSALIELATAQAIAPLAAELTATRVERVRERETIRRQAEELGMERGKRAAAEARVRALEQEVQAERHRHRPRWRFWAR